MKRTLSGVVEISTAALTVTSQPPVFTGEVGALEASISFLLNGEAADITAYTAEMYLFWPERRQMSEAIEMAVSGSTAVGSFGEELTALAGAPLFIIQLTDENGRLIIACAQPLQITQTRGDVVVTTRPPTPSEIVYIGRSPYVDPTTKEWMQWDTAAGEYVSTGVSTEKAAEDAESAAERAEGAADALDDLTVGAVTIQPGGVPTATVSDIDGHKHIVFGIVTGDTGATPDMTIGTVQTLPAGSSATASITGTAEDPVLNLGIPKGDQGVKGNTGATPALSVGTVQTLGEDDPATVTITGTAENPVLNFGIPQGKTGSASGVYATNVPMSASDPTTVAQAIAAAGKVETVAGVGVAAGTKNVPLTGADLPMSSSDTTKVSTKLSTLETGVSVMLRECIEVLLPNVSDSSRTYSVEGIRAAHKLVNDGFALLSNPAAAGSDLTLTTADDGTITVGGTLTGTTNIKAAFCIKPATVTGTAT